MRFVIFCHSLISDWNHGNAHFLRGVVSDLLARGHAVDVYEPEDAWSAVNLAADAGSDALTAYRSAYPQLTSKRYDAAHLDLEAVLAGADVVIVHEWNERELVARIGEIRARGGHFRLFFHDTHHRSVSDPGAMSRYDLREYDGVLAFGRVIAEAYRRNGWATRAWTWHEAADVRVFHPREAIAPDGDVAWIGNWGDDERAAELREFLIEPVRDLELRAAVYGVRYPPEALSLLHSNEIDFRGWLANHRVPEVLARYRVTIHVPRGPYVRDLPGVPTIRVFEALACGIPLVSARWEDLEGLFSPGEDYLVVRSGDEMREALQSLLESPARARALAEHGLRTILTRHTCAHRVDELLRIIAELGGSKDVGTRAA